VGPAMPAQPAGLVGQKRIFSEGRSEFASKACAGPVDELRSSEEFAVIRERRLPASTGKSGALT